MTNPWDTMIILLALAIAFFALALSFGYYISAPKHQGPVTDHFDGQRFINPGNIKAKGLGDALKWMMGRKRGEWKEKKDVAYGEKPVARVDQGIRITFINHSTFLIQVDGLNIITDPVWSNRTSPMEWAGPKRMRPPGIRLEELPKIDVMLLSHNHWDHLDIKTVKKIHSVHHPKIVTPLGVKAFLEQEGVLGAEDIDWWQEEVINNSMIIQSVPAHHFSGRGMFDRDATLWCGYVIKRTGGNIYFVGDTGYDSGTFKKIGERCAPMEVALVPIGAFRPQWFMSPIHCSPEEAVKIHRDIKTKTSIATHFGTFPLADDGETEPVDELKKAIQKYGIEATSFLVLREGVPHDL